MAEDWIMRYEPIYSTKLKGVIVWEIVW